MDGRSCALLITSAPLPHIVGAFSLLIFALLCPFALSSPTCCRRWRCSPERAQTCGIFPASQNVACQATSARCYIFSASAQSVCTMFDFFIIPPFVACEATFETERCYFFSPSRLLSPVKRHFAMLKFFIILPICRLSSDMPRRTMLYFFSISLLAKLNTSQNRRRVSVFRLHPCTLASFVPHRITKPRCRVVPNPAHWLHSTPTHARMHVYTHAFGEISEKIFIISHCKTYR